MAKSNRKKKSNSPLGRPSIKTKKGTNLVPLNTNFVQIEKDRLHTSWKLFVIRASILAGTLGIFAPIAYFAAPSIVFKMVLIAALATFLFSLRNQLNYDSIQRQAIKRMEKNIKSRRF